MIAASYSAMRGFLALLGVESNSKPKRVTERFACDLEQRLPPGRTHKVLGLAGTPTLALLLEAAVKPSALLARSEERLA